ncbi:SDR family oxidoreductase [Streptomyces cylindrosporus]|uniref:NmrA family NAD(P)-binding protein n=1 Tax=Streptomyces cylindrosporus TaxID=2927583 RepID=A0ABS9YA92_9ACTN|nr:NmrA family NAD(P)-binding protein [Streptomyces cylindrosporus]MCI3273536.1 NmrA family NAD(P)-binding protein [Streptomyces cylindrosporus]
MKALMVGATGRNAGAVLPELVARGVTARALVRDAARADVALRRGAAETVVGDLADPDSLPPAVDGVDGVFHIGPAFAPDEAAMGVAMVEAARTAGVRKFVFSGVIHPSISALGNHTTKLAVEEALYDSGMDFTVLQPARFMQNWAPAWREVVERGRLPMPYPVTARFCWVDYRDVAEAAALAMTGDELRNGTFELCAPGMPDGRETAAVAGEVLDRHIEAEQVSATRFAAQLPAGPEHDGLVRMLTHYAGHGLAGGNPLVLRAVLGREPRSLRQYFSELSRHAPSDGPR